MEAILVAIINSIGIIINTSMNKKTNKKIETIDTIKSEFKAELNNVKREQDKTYLTDFLSEVENGQPKSEIQVKRAYEVYEEYKKLNGNSYVHDKFEELKKKGLI